jgi:hypothetical protein
MDKLAIAYVTCDKYSHVWEEWYSQYLKTWDIKLPVYWCGEELPAIDNDFIQLHHPCVEVDKWTTKLRTQIEQIPEEYIFTWLDDAIPQKNICRQFAGLYLWMLANDADSMRIMYRATKASYLLWDKWMGEYIRKLSPDSRYRVSFSPNIWRKSFLLEVLQGDESPWSVELGSTGKFPDKNLYAYYIDEWIRNGVIQ